MEIRSDFNSAKLYLERLLLYAKVFHENNVKNWSHLKHREDFKSVYGMELNARSIFERIYSVGRDLASYMSSELGAFNDPGEYPTLTSYVRSLEGGWLSDIDKLKELSAQAKEQQMKMKENYSWAVAQMIILFDKQVELLQHVVDTLNILKTTEIYKIESAGQIMEKPTITVQGDYLNFQNISTTGGGQVFIGKFNEAIATMKNAGQSELAKAFQELQEAILSSSYLTDEKKKEHVEVLNQIGEEVAKEKPNTTLIKVLGDGLLSILKSIPDIVRAVEALIPLLPL